MYLHFSFFFILNKRTITIYNLPANKIDFYYSWILFLNIISYKIEQNKLIAQRVYLIKSVGFEYV